MFCLKSDNVYIEVFINVLFHSLNLEIQSPLFFFSILGPYYFLYEYQISNILVDKHIQNYILMVLWKEH